MRAMLRLAALFALWSGIACAQERPGPLPIMVVVQTTGRVAPEVSAAAQQALVEQLTAMAGGRPVHALANEEVQAALAACRDDACHGAQLATANVQTGAYLRLRARGRRLEASIELRDPVSGVLRAPAVSGELDAANMAASMQALSAQVTGAMPSPPPPPSTLLVTVNVDGASVQIDGDDVGSSPVAAVEVAEGPHDVSVTLAGYQAHRRRIEVRAGEQARADVTLVRASANVAAGASVEVGDDDPGFFREDAPRSSDVTSEWWFWTIIGGGAAVILAVAIGVGVGVSSQGPSEPAGIPLPPIEGM